MKTNKNRSLFLKALIFILKIPLDILITGLTTKTEEKSETFIDLYRRHPELLDEHPPRHRYLSEINDQ